MSSYIAFFWKLFLAATLSATVACTTMQSPSQAASPLQESAPATGDQTPGTFTGTVLETMDSGGYSYVLVDTGKQEIWAAGPQTAVQVGDAVSIPGGMPMKNFHSKTLNRTFDVLYFVGTIETGNTNPMQAAVPSHGSGTRRASPTGSQVDFSNIKKVEGGQTIAGLYAERERLADKEVIVRGRVVKFNPGIMNRNWLHLRDGTGAEGSDDVTVTSRESAQLGDLVVVRGTLKLDQDFGFGYAYELLIENASVVVE